MRGFDLFQLVHERIVLCVRDFRCVEDVVLVFVVAQLGAEIFSAGGGVSWRVRAFGFGHGVNYRRRRGVMAGESGRAG